MEAFNVTNSDAMQHCIEQCTRCHQTCLTTALTHCLDQGGRHVEPTHMRLMIMCAEICQTAADFMLSRVDQHNIICGACAQVCQACAEGCEAIGDMDCATACEQMAKAA
jgi:hypothetical protein